MIRKLAILLGLSIVLSLLFPIAQWTHKMPLVMVFTVLPPVDAVFAAVVLFILPAFLLLHLANVWSRIPETGRWVPVLGALSVLYLVIHMNWISSVLYPLGYETATTLSEIAEIAVKSGLLISLIATFMSLQPSEQALRAEGDMQ